MCGITGWVSWHRDLTTEATTLARMVASLTCPGPDRAATWTSRHAALGQQRRAGAGSRAATDLAVVAADGGPPVVLALHGELYHAAELRTRLRQRGHRRPLATDAELLLEAYLEWGEAAVEHCDGVFGFALWDARAERLLLGRDRLGVKPLYYAEVDGGVLFGAKPAAVLANPSFAAEVDAEGLVDVFVVGARRPGDAVFRNLREVRPGTTVRFDRSGRREHRYWRLTSRPHTDDPMTTVATVRELLDAAVRARSVAETPVGGLLSGGLDSSVLCAMAAPAVRDAGHGKLDTYSVDFAGSDTDFKADALHVSRDAPYIDAVVTHLGSNHTEVLLDAPSLLEHLPTTLAARDVPGVGDLDVSLYLLFREVRRHAAVVLSGEGADDLFGGYPWFLAESNRPTDNFPWSAGVTDRNAMLGPELRRHLDLDAAVARRYAEALDEVPHLAGETGADRRMREVYHLQLTRFLPFLLDRMDRMSTAAGLDVRVPFCDHRLVEYLWNVPWQLKRLGDQEKGLLRQAAVDLLPEPVVRRPKSGFPVGQSPQYLTAIRDAVRALLDDGTSPALAVLNEPALRALVESDSWSVGAFSPPPVLPRALLIDAWLRRYGVSVRL